MEIVKETAENFANVGGGKRGTKPTPETIAMQEMAPGDVIRIKDHEHRMMRKSKQCTLASRLTTNAHNHNRSISTRHDGADLLVMRVK